MEYGLLAHHYFELGKYEEAILYWTKDINYPEYDCYFSDELTEACFKLNDINKGIAIINGAIEKDWDDAAKSVAYEGIGDIYSKIHNNPQAVQYYKKSLQLWLKLKSMNYDWVDDNIKRMKDKIRQCGN
jgi:tetratricopeptide (TPR) repeat protein